MPRPRNDFSLRKFQREQINKALEAVLQEDARVDQVLVEFGCCFTALRTAVKAAKPGYTVSLSRNRVVPTDGKQGRPKGLANEAPVPGSVSAKVLEDLRASDLTAHGVCAAIGRKHGVSRQLVQQVAARWLPGAIPMRDAAFEADRAAKMNETN